MNRSAVTAACTTLVLALSTACELPVSGPDAHGLAELRLTADVTGTPINVLVVEVTATDIATPLVFNLIVQNGVAQGTIRIPPGSARKITVRAYDTDGNLTHEGSKTIDVKPGQNPPVSIPMVPRAGQVSITVTLGPVSVVVQPASPTVQVGAHLQLSVTITAASGEMLAGPAEWATTSPAIATVDQSGNVTAVKPGTVDIVATFAGVAGVSHVTVASQIAFSSDGNIFLISADGSNPIQLTSGNKDAWPAWSPDGAKIAFGSWREQNNYEIYVMNADGTGVTRLTSDPASDYTPFWSPDGTKIAFASDRDGNFEIYVMNADGTGVVRLTNDGRFDLGPAWSPDGLKIAFTSFRSGQPEVYVMNANGTGLVPLTDNLGFDPAWSPDGTRIAFGSTRNGTVEIYVMNADGSGVTKLTSNDAIEDGPAWSPNGTKIAFRSDRDGNSEIYSMNADGTAQTRLTNSPVFDAFPRWRP